MNVFIFEAEIAFSIQIIIFYTEVVNFNYLELFKYLKLIGNLPNGETDGRKGLTNRWINRETVEWTARLLDRPTAI
jgi:hypothetical protein